VDVFNAGGTAGLAAQVSKALTKVGYRAGEVANASPRSTTVVAYGAGAAANGSKIAKLFGVTAAANRSVPAGNVEVVLGSDASVPDVAPSTASPSPSATPTPGPEGGAVSAGNGIPCVN
jgi:hypothetical protein